MEPPSTRRMSVSKSVPAEAEFLDSLAAPLATHLNIGGVPVRIAVNTERLAGKVRRYFAPFVCAPFEGGLTVVGVQAQPFFRAERLADVERKSGTPKVACYDEDGLRVIFKKRTGVVHYVRSDTFYAVGDLERHPQQLLNLVATAFGCWLRREGYVALHASAVSAGGLAIVFAGNSGSGKSSAALTMMNQGFDFVSNDRVFLRRTDGLVEVVGVPKWPRVNPGTLMANPKLRGILAADRHDVYSRLSPEELWELEHKHDVFVTTVYGKNRVSLKAFLISLYVLTWRHGRGPADAEAVPGGDVGRLLTPMVKTEVYDVRSGDLPNEDELSALLAGHSVVHVSGGVDMARLLEIAEGKAPVA